jgi:hypothetical protein
MALAQEAGAERPMDGLMVAVLRILLRYPEVLAWDRLWYEGKEEVNRLLAGAVKAARPGAEYGLHVHHSATALDIVYRAQVDYAELAEYCDFIKPVTYHDVCGPRSRRMLEAMRKTFFGELSEELVLGLYYAALGLDSAKEPTWDELPRRGFTTDWTYREVARCVAAAKGRAKVYSGVGLDVTGMRSKPEEVYDAVRRSYDAGADGLLISREYNEMHVPNLKAVGKALQDAGK